MSAEFLGDMDDEPLQLVLKLQQKYIRELQQQDNVQPGDGHQDDQLALELYQEDLLSLATNVSDRAMSRRVEMEEAREAEHEGPVDGAAAQH
ncbi:IBR finger domain-containing protein [Colletotrichum tofieldiae]|uniref:IBR finger domain-containing protein n=1 Tax=Colletotrichum tofieldiae TaxID=708197 RepID=A0A166N9S5_9PEZI|nr:IBR finger domain-containing protein [Colletotrichum tofieldiae]GKT59434.1 IBR finger domain-containing protein [Colletotrichum tofieldiae]GKT78231.1 IBR finger domain-containing protein [Colletotrichum tofieldiae]GKT85593.1 IBR finger domain-containing protein [Colletotrichum tofieldiae]